MPDMPGTNAGRAASVSAALRSMLTGVGVGVLKSKSREMRCRTCKRLVVRDRLFGVIAATNLCERLDAGLVGAVANKRACCSGDAPLFGRHEKTADKSQSLISCERVECWL